MQGGEEERSFTRLWREGNPAKRGTDDALMVDQGSILGLRTLVVNASFSNSKNHLMKAP
jgi:hypothetical protein